MYRNNPPWGNANLKGGKKGIWVPSPINIKFLILHTTITKPAFLIEVVAAYFIVVVVFVTRAYGGVRGALAVN